MTAVMVVAAMALMMARGVLPGLAGVSGHAGMRLVTRRCLSPTGQREQHDR